MYWKKIRLMNIMIFLGIFKYKKRNFNSRENSTQSLKWPDHIVSLNEGNFEEFIQKYPLAIVDFWAPWCAPCKMMAPRLRHLSKIYNGRVAFGKLDTQENQNIAKQYKITGIPHLMIFRYGKKTTSATGVRSIGDVKNMINKLLEKKDK